MGNIDLDQFEKLGNILTDQAIPMKQRNRALFTLKNLGGEPAVRNIARALNDPSALLKHEAAYCLGQMQNENAIKYLINTLQDAAENPMVRHEAGEALGAIGKSTVEVKEALTKYAADPNPDVAETCEIALGRLEWLEKQADIESKDLSKNPYFSVDPAPPTVHVESVAELKAKLLDESLGLFERYRAMFGLRNNGSDEAILALCEGLKCKSALFRHEIAYVLGQIQSVLSVDALKVNLQDATENNMVRHECAETLGSIGTKACVEVLEKYLKDAEPVVRESCEVALDISEYENNNVFQYADGLNQVNKV